MQRRRNRVSRSSELVQRYLDGDMSELEAAHFRARLAESPELRQELLELQRVGELVRTWAAGAEARGARLVEPTLARVQAAEKRTLHRTVGTFAVALLLIGLSPWSATNTLQHRTGLAEPRLPAAARAGAAIERLDSGVQHATVFVVGRSGTPVVWLSDDVETGADAAQPGPG
jgi:anti-sigma factor RsiW